MSLFFSFHHFLGFFIIRSSSFFQVNTQKRFGNINIELLLCTSSPPSQKKHGTCHPLRINIIEEKKIDKIWRHGARARFNKKRFWRVPRTSTRCGRHSPSSFLWFHFVLCCVHLIIKIVSRILKEKRETRRKYPIYRHQTPWGLKRRPHTESLYTWTNEKELLLYMTTAIKYLKMSKSPIKKEKFLLNNNNNPSQENLQLLRTQYSNVSR